MRLSNDDRQRISAAIHAAERRSSGEIVCVLAETSTAGTALPVLLAALLSLVLPWVLVAFTEMTVQRILLLQLLAFAVLFAAGCLPAVHASLTPRWMRRALAHRLAQEQFIMRGMARTTDRSGILIFVSHAEHYARIIADDGIAARVPQREWQAAVDALIVHMREDRIAEGFIAAIEICADKLADHFPRTASDRSELPDRIYVI
jgi:putative membrane protein